MTAIVYLSVRTYPEALLYSNYIIYQQPEIEILHISKAFDALKIVPSFWIMLMDAFFFWMMVLS